MKRALNGLEKTLHASVALGLCGLLGLLGLAKAAAATEITVLSAAAVQAPITEVAEQFERSTGHRVRFEFSTAGGVDGKVKAGAKPDIVINARERLDALSGAKLVGAAAARNLGVVQIGIAVRKGGVKPDISSADGFRASLLKAESIAYGDPAKGPTTGIHFAKVLERLGIADAIKPKAKLADNGLDVMRLVAKGDAELGVTQVSEILHIQGDTLVGPLPQELQLKTTYAITFSSDDANPVARQFAEALLSKAGREHFIHAGFQ